MPAHRFPNLRLPQTDRPYRGSLALSVLVHALLIGFLVREHIRALETAPAVDSRAPGAPGTRGGGGGEIRFELAPYEAAEDDRPSPVPPPPPPPPVAVTPPAIKIQKLDMPNRSGTVTSSVDLSNLGGQGPGKGGGIGTGVGPGVGADSGAGTGGDGGDTFPPRAKFAILPPLPPPPSVRGKAFRVHFWINAKGQVTAVRVEPEIKDAAYRQQFLALMRGYDFEPAYKRDSTRVDGEMTITITL